MIDTIYLQVVQIAGHDRAVHGGAPLRSRHRYRQQLRLNGRQIYKFVFESS